MKNKKSIMGLAALLILIFHFYIPFSQNSVELAIYKAGYVGVDLFFFVSAVSLGKREDIPYFNFIWNRFCAIYLPFVFLAVVCAFYKGWGLGRLIKVICGLEFLQKGGGAFLWFFPGIMMVYLFVPFMLRAKKRFGFAGLLILLAVWFLLALFFTYVVPYRAIFILLHRLPIFFIGLFYEKIKERIPAKLFLLLSLVGLIIGSFMIYRWASVHRLGKPLTDFYYLLALPWAVSISVFLDEMLQKAGNAKGFRSLAFLGAFTLEIYGLQMIFGYDIETAFFRICQPRQLAFFLTVLALLVLAWLFHEARNKVRNIVMMRKEKSL